MTEYQIPFAMELLECKNITQVNGANSSYHDYSTDSSDRDIVLSLNEDLATHPSFCKGEKNPIKSVHMECFP